MTKKIALVTGASSGIGAGVCRALSAQGVSVAVCDVNETAGLALANEIGGLYLPCDVSSLPSVEEAVKACVNKLGIPDYVHLNAGVMTVPTGEPFLAIEDVSEAQYRKIVGVNLDGVYNGLRTVLPIMREKGGGVTITASTAGLSVVPVDPLYTATKYALVGLGRAVSAANEGSNIRINVICPGVTDTQIVPDEYRGSEFNVMPVDVMAAEIVELLTEGANGEIRVKVSAERPAFAAPLPALD